jgi:hypothetical protein
MIVALDDFKKGRITAVGTGDEQPVGDAYWDEDEIRDVAIEDENGV